MFRGLENSNLWHFRQLAGLDADESPVKRCRHWFDEKFRVSTKST